jgi:hypothetical protein
VVQVKSSNIKPKLFLRLLSLYSHGGYGWKNVSLKLNFISKAIVFRRYNASLYVPFFWVDDYYITGAVASAANVTYAQLGSLYTIPQQLAHTRFMSSKSFYTIMFGHFVNMNNDDFLIKIVFFV